MGARFFMAKRLDNHDRIFFVAAVRFDMGGNVISEDEYKTVSSHREFKKIEGKVLEFSEIDTSSKKKMLEAIKACEAKPSETKAKTFLMPLIEEIEELEDSNSSRLANEASASAAKSAKGGKGKGPKNKDQQSESGSIPEDDLNLDFDDGEDRSGQED
jgi:ribosomal protein L12E/L44/L45/RPP1/RPP2